jgi:integrase
MVSTSDSVAPAGDTKVQVIWELSAKKAPATSNTLAVEEFQLIVATLQEPYRMMVQIAQCLGLRVSEIAALQWGDFDFDKNQLLVQRSFVNGRVDDVETEYSQDDIPLHASLTEIVLKWSTQAVPTEEGWVFVNPRTTGLTIPPRSRSGTFAPRVVVRWNVLRAGRHLVSGVTKIRKPVTAFVCFCTRRV